MTNETIGILPSIEYCIELMYVDLILFCKLLVG